MRLAMPYGGERASRDDFSCIYEDKCGNFSNMTLDSKCPMCYLNPSSFNQMAYVQMVKADGAVVSWRCVDM